MVISQRDLGIIRLVGEFGQLASSHIGEILFASNKSGTPLDRSLARLCRYQYLLRIGRRTSEYKGGSPPFVYQLGPRGWRLVERTDRWQRRAMSEHCLRRADVFVAIRQAENRDTVQLQSCELEEPIGKTRADMAIKLALPSEGTYVSYFIEIDLGTERPSRIAEKCNAYWQAFNEQDGGIFPWVLYLVPDTWRESEVRRVIARLEPEAHELFKVCQLSALR
jgi:hypothetical protein